VTTARCPVCGTAGGACTGHASFDLSKVISTEGAIVADKIYVPKQRVKRGVAGYRGKNIVVVDAKGRQDAAPEKKSK
jgi:hypothetical protein